MQREQDKYKYQGRAFDFIGFDELTHFTFDQYMYLLSRNRPNGAGTRVYIRATANPGGVGHGWVKDRFITAASPMTTVYDNVSIVFPDGHEEVHKKSRIFVPAQVFDNAELMKNDPEYITRLASMPEADRNALLYGDWDSFSGQVFTEWRNAPNPDRTYTHVIEPFPIPKSWRIYRGFDFGYSRPFSVGWYAVDHDNRLYRIRELYGCTGTPNEGVKWEPAKIAREIAAIEQDDPNLAGRTVYGVADPSIYDESRGESVAAMMEREGIYFDKADNKRIPGKMQLHNRLAFDDNGFPMLYVFDTCKHFIRTIPALVYDETNVEDIDTDTEDHCLSGDTLVHTENGTKLICEMVGTEGYVLSHDGQYHRYRDVRLTQSSAKVYDIITEDGKRVRATANHRFMLSDGTWKRLDELKPGDDLMCVVGSKCRTISAIIPAGTEPVYNMEVQDTHDFVVNNGIVVHNCYDEVRYICMEYPINPPERVAEPPKPYSPLEHYDNPDSTVRYFRR